eukprot:15335322-Ditylum_brightwellii.AAC.1
MEADVAHHKFHEGINVTLIQSKRREIRSFSQYKWPKTANGQKKKDGGHLELDIPEPQWLADPAHRTKIVAICFEIKAKEKVLSIITTADCLRCKKKDAHMYNIMKEAYAIFQERKVL